MGLMEDVDMFTCKEAKSGHACGAVLVCLHAMSHICLAGLV